jgi:hypothetical protein
LITDAGEETLRAGDCAAFKSGDPDGHRLVNKSDSPARVLEIGTSDPRDRCTYPDIDMIADDRGYTATPSVTEPRTHQRKWAALKRALAVNAYIDALVAANHRDLCASPCIRPVGRIMTRVCGELMCS